MTYFRIVIFTIVLPLVFPQGAFGQMNPVYAATVAGEWSGTIKRGLFLAQTGVGASQKMTSDHWERISVDSFTVLVLRDTAVILNYRNKGNTFQDKLRERFNELLVGDRILIFEIYTTDRRNRKVLLQPLEYIID